MPMVIVIAAEVTGTNVPSLNTKLKGLLAVSPVSVRLVKVA